MATANIGTIRAETHLSSAQRSDGEVERPADRWAKPSLIVICSRTLPPRPNKSRKVQVFLSL